MFLFSNIYLYNNLYLQKTFQMKNILFIVLYFSLLTGALISCGSKSKNDNTTETTTEQKREPAKDKFIKMAKEANAQMPMPMPGGIRMDKVEAVSKNEFKYYYTFTQTPSVTPEEFIRNTKVALTLALQQTKGDDLDMFRSEKMTLIYAYYTMKGELFAEIAVFPEEYSIKH